MSLARTIPDDTRARQHRASSPHTSAWVSANAGSGKTFVLSQRVVRLLLAGVPPSRILCLTFTKAAAANMSLRVFRTLSAWTTLEDAELAAEIEATGTPRPSATTLIEARRLFARTVDSPGGLRIQTIHAFCERLLHLFPFEANVPARFAVLEDLMRDDLLARARSEALVQAVADPDTELGRAVAYLAEESTAVTFDALVTEALRHNGRLGEDAASASRLTESLGIRADETSSSIADAMLGGGLAVSEWAATAQHLGADGGPKDTAANRLALAASVADEERLGRYLAVFLTAKNEARADTYLPKALRAAHPDLAAQFDAERGRLVDLLARRRAAETVERTRALLTVTRAVLSRYETAKARRGLLDFDDLIERMRALLRSAGAPWVLYKLDGGIDHVLVDEAQDTSPPQWEILRALTAEFFAGAGQARAIRTFFAVGDEKQSIFSFQGARPATFDRLKHHFATSAGDADFAAVNLNLSFRSARTVLETVDRIFAHPAHARGLSAGDERPLPHEPLRAALPGLVQVWPAIGATDLPEPRDWRLPVDQADPQSPPVILARQVAATIAGLIAPDSRDTVEGAVPGERRPVRPGDIMILVRTRNAFFETVIRALKDRRVPVAGADRLVLTEHIAVMDLMAAGRAALLPDDDLTVACVMKSPLICLDDDDLIALAPGRPHRLLDAAAASLDPRHRAAAARLAIWRDRATKSPFEFYAQLLGADGGRKALLERLGPEAGDAIDEFLALTLTHEREGPPSLLAFLTRLEGESLSIKRDMEAAGDAVRVMTVHAAKGLEAKIVFLPDTCGAPTGRHDPKLFVLDDSTDGPASGVVAWSPRKEADAPAVAAARTALREAATEEHNRLLYVALTRAEERLYIAGFYGKKRPDDCWYAMIEATDLDLVRAPAPWDADATVMERRDPGLLAEQIRRSTIAESPAHLPEWLFRSPAHEVAYAPPVRPSNALGAADQQPLAPDGFDAERDTKRRDAALAGRLAHRLLQHLPSLATDQRRTVANRLADNYGAGLEPERKAALIDDVCATIANPALADLFGPQSRAEVSLAGTAILRDGRSIAITGQIDRISITDRAVLIADFKTGRPHDLDTIPGPYKAQLALYCAAVAPLYPGLPVRAFLVWTAGPSVVELPPALLEATLDELAAG